MARPSMYPPELRRRAVRMVAEIRDGYPTETAALNAVMEKLGIGSRETLRKWIRQDQIDTGQRPWKTLSHVELATAEWVDWYNHRRLHGEIGHIPPVEYEANYYRATTKPQLTAAN